MKQRTEFKITFGEKTTHWVNVMIHTSRRTMRGYLRAKGNHDSSSTNAACWQANKPGRDGCIAEIHLAADFLSLENIAHECTHAAWGRCRVLGLKFEEDSRDGFEEWLAGCTGQLVDVCLAHLDRAGIKVHYECASKRSATKRYVKK
jgi:hypothetical protein